MSDAVRFEIVDEIGVVHLDDGKANALSSARLAEIDAALDSAEAQAKALVLVGREGKFSAGFDLSEMGGGDLDATRRLVGTGAELAARLLLFPIPVVSAVTGHALAMGAFLALSSDLRLLARGPFKIGLNEVAIGMPLPYFGTELARARLSKRYLSRSVALAEIFDPETAVDAGFGDRVVDPDALLDEALAAAKQLGGLNRAAHAATKAGLRGDLVARMRASIAEDPLAPTFG